MVPEAMLDRKAGIMDKQGQALAYFEEGFSCAQSVLAAYSAELGLDATTAVRVAGAFGGGMARTGQTCGAITGALMVIGLKHGQVRAGDAEAKEATYKVAQEFMERFKALHGAMLCPELIGYDLANPAGRQAARESGALTLCPRLVEDAVRLLTELQVIEAEPSE